MTQSKPAFVFVHGAWHNGGTWRYVIAGLEATGHVARALDLPGAGVNAKMPLSFFQRPLDAAAFANEPSPNAGVRQEERTQAVIDLIRGLESPVVLVGHSLGGLTISDVAEAVPGDLAALVYLTAFLLPPGMSVHGIMQHETMASTVAPALRCADPAQVGASRFDPRSDDPSYRAKIKAALYADVNDNEFALALQSLHCDEPAGVRLRPSLVTSGRFGTVPRHYIRCLEDRTIPLSGQDFMIATADAALGGKTIQHTLSSSHSPFYSQPDALVGILEGIAN